MTIASSTDEPTGQAEGPFAPAASADPEFLELYAQSNRFRLGRPRAMQILPDDSGILYLRTGPQDFDGLLYFLDARSGQERVLLRAADLLAGAEELLSAEERARRERMRLSARGIASFRLSPDGSQILIPLSGRLFLVERERIGSEGAVRELLSDAGPAIDPRFSPQGDKIVTVRSGDLYLVDPATGGERRLTTRSGEEVQNGLAEFVAQEEMGRMRGFWWSPDGGSIAYQQTDHSGMERMHILDPAHPENEPQSWPYPRPGMANASVRLGVLDLSSGRTRWVEWDRDRFPYLATVRWPEAGELTLLVQDRLQEDERLLKIDSQTLQSTELLAEEDEAWLNIDQSVPRWLADGRFLWSTEREGGAQLELRAADGSLIRALTTPEFGYQALLGIDEERGKIWFRGGSESTETHVHTLSLNEEGAEPVAQTEGRGVHEGLVAHDGGVWVHGFADAEGRHEQHLKSFDGNILGELPQDAQPSPLTPQLSFETVGERQWRTVTIRPTNFDPELRYPVILHVYGGPGAQMVRAETTRYLLSQWQADHNFILVSIDGRGTPSRGRQWERAIDGDFISVSLDDQVDALQALAAEHPEMDMERVGVWGWSFGGYFSAMAALRRPDVFRAAVAGAPVTEWRDYDTHYTERFIGLPEEQGDEGAYRRSSVLTFAAEEVDAERLRPLLTIHGTADDNVYFSHALKLQNALLASGRPNDLLALTGLTHMVPDAQVMRRMHERIIAFFETNLRR